MGGEFFIRSSSIRISYLSRRLSFERVRASLVAMKIELEGKKVGKEEARLLPSGEQLRMSYRSPVIGLRIIRVKRKRFLTPRAELVPIVPQLF